MVPAIRTAGKDVGNGRKSSAHISVPKTPKTPRTRAAETPFAEEAFGTPSKTVLPVSQPPENASDEPAKHQAAQPSEKWAQQQPNQASLEQAPGGQAKHQQQQQPQRQPEGIEYPRSSVWKPPPPIVLPKVRSGRQAAAQAGKRAGKHAGTGIGGQFETAVMSLTAGSVYIPYCFQSFYPSILTPPMQPLPF